MFHSAKLGHLLSVALSGSFYIEGGVQGIGTKEKKKEIGLHHQFEELDWLDTIYQDRVHHIHDSVGVGQLVQLVVEGDERQGLLGHEHV